MRRGRRERGGIFTGEGTVQCVDWDVRRRIGAKSYDVFGINKVKYLSRHTGRVSGRVVKGG